jgi:pimeloyl-ACP methyl ester carboxylesterase
MRGSLQAGQVDCFWRPGQHIMAAMATLLLLPGLDGTGELFAAFVAALRDHEVRIIAYPLDRALGYPALEEFVREKLPRDQDYFLLAESFSGPIGISIAASSPPHLKGLVLCSSFASNPLPALGPLATIFQWLPAVRVPATWTAPWLYAGRETPELRRAHADAMAKVSRETLHARVAAVLAVDNRPLLARIKVPMLYLRATADRLIPLAAGREIVDLRPDVEWVEIDAPHFMLQTEPRACAQAVEKFMGTDLIPDPALDVEQSMRVSRLSQEDLWDIDREILAQSAHSWRKVARIVGQVIDKLSSRIPDVPDTYYAQRVRHLVEIGKLESQGDLHYMRHGEVRLPG